MVLLRPLISAALFLCSVPFLTTVAGKPQEATTASGGDISESWSYSATAPAASSSGGAGGASAPHFVIYDRKELDTGAPDVSDIEGYNVFALAFLLSDGPNGQAATWAQLDDSKRKEIKSQYEAAGIKLIVSAFGSQEHPTTAGADARELAGTMADWVLRHDLDGIDVNYEDVDAFDVADGKAEEWVTTFTKTLREKLPQGEYIITHAPAAYWFNAEIYNQAGAYQTVHKNVGDMIDWYNVQFYNQKDFNDCNTLLHQSQVKTSLFEIIDSGVDPSKVVLGKPATATDVDTDGFIEPSELAQCVSEAKEKGWNGGVMVWQYPSAGSDWIKTVRGDAFPLAR